jgi:hypothetical protein
MDLSMKTLICEIHDKPIRMMAIGNEGILFYIGCEDCDQDEFYELRHIEEEQA